MSLRPNARRSASAPKSNKPNSFITGLELDRFPAVSRRECIEFPDRCNRLGGRTYLDRVALLAVKYGEE